jgi:hypothetical protein
VQGPQRVALRFEAKQEAWQSQVVKQNGRAGRTRLCSAGPPHIEAAVSVQQMNKSKVCATAVSWLLFA